MSPDSVGSSTSQAASSVNMNPTGGGGGGTSGAGGVVSGTFKSMLDFKNKVGAKVYNSLMQAIAWTICSDMKKKEDQRIEREKEYQRQNK